MNTELIENPEQSGEPSNHAETGGKTGSAPVLGVVALLTALAGVLIGAGGIYYSMQLAPRIPEIDPLQSRLQTTQAAVNTASAQLRQLETELQQLRQQQQSILGSISALNREQNYTLDAVLAEFENLLVIASQRLALTRDVDTALAAMQSVQDRLQNLDEPALIPFRQVFTTDMSALRDVQAVDITGLALYLADISSRVQTLPVRRPGIDEASEEDTAEEQQSDSTGSVLSRLGEEILSTLKDLVKVYPADGGSVIALLPEQQYYLYQNLRLQLEIARLSVMRRETENFRASIDTCLDWLQTYFETSDRRISNIIDSLSGMQSIELDPPVPDISSSLESLRALIRQGDILDTDPGRQQGRTVQ